MLSFILKSKIFRNFGANAYGQLVTVLIQVVSVPLFIKFWGVKAYGEWLILSAIPSYLSMSDIGFASVAANDMTMRMARGDNKGCLEVYQSIWVFVVLVSCIVSAGFVLALSYFPVHDIFSLNKISDSDAFQVLILQLMYVVVSLQSGVLSAGFRAIGRYANNTIIGNNIRLAEWFVSIVSLVKGGDMAFVASNILIVRTIGTVIWWQSLQLREKWLCLGYKHASLKKISELSKPALAFMAFPIGLAFSLQSVVLIIGIYLGASEVAAFTAFRTVSRLLIQAAAILNQSVWPEISTAFGAGNLNATRNLYVMGSCVTFWVALIAVVSMGVGGDYLITLWTNNSLPVENGIFRCLLGAAFVNVLWQPSSVVLLAINMHRKIALAFMASSVIGFILCLVFVQPFGLNGIVVTLALIEVPLLIYAVKSALAILKLSFFEYFKGIFSNPLIRIELLHRY